MIIDAGLDYGSWRAILKHVHNYYVTNDELINNIARATSGGPRQHEKEIYEKNIFIFKSPDNSYYTSVEAHYNYSTGLTG